jgi:DNA-binding CsgD family transcriptional regulator
VLALIGAGRSAAQIAVTLEISPHEVVNHTRHILVKLDARSRTQAARLRRQAVALFDDNRGVLTRASFVYL